MQPVKRSVAAWGWGEGGINRWHTEDFQSPEIILYDTKMAGTRHCTFVEACRIYSTKSEPGCKPRTVGDNVSMQVHQL